MRFLFSVVDGISIFEHCTLPWQGILSKKLTFNNTHSYELFAI